MVATIKDRDTDSYSYSAEDLAGVTRDIERYLSDNLEDASQISEIIRKIILMQEHEDVLMEMLSKIILKEGDDIEAEVAVFLKYIFSINSAEDVEISENDVSSFIDGVRVAKEKERLARERAVESEGGIQGKEEERSLSFISQILFGTINTMLFTVPFTPNLTVSTAHLSLTRIFHYAFYNFSMKPYHSRFLG